MPLLFETGARRLASPVVVVACTPEAQVLPAHPLHILAQRLLCGAAAQVPLALEVAA
jgi:hypothetical protein